MFFFTQNEQMLKQLTHFLKIRLFLEEFFCLIASSLRYILIMKQQPTMRAIYLQGPMKFTVKNLPIPKPNDSQVLIKVMAAPINPSDYYFLRDANYDHKKAPCIPGFEGSGVVIENGGGIMGWGLVNKKVAFTPVDRSGTYAQYAIAKSSQCLPVDDSMSFEHASMSFVNPLTAMAMLDYAKQHKTKAVIMNAAASALGRMANRLIPPEKIQIINIVRRQEQVQILKKQGANYVLNSSEPDFEQKLKETVTKLNATVFYDAIGGESTAKIMGCMPKNSTIYVYGALEGGFVKNVPVMSLIYMNMNVKGLFLPTWLQEKGTLKLLPTFMKLRKLLLNQLRSDIAWQFGLQQFQQNLKQYLKNMTKGKAVLRPYFEPKEQEKLLQREKQAQSSTKKQNKE